MKNKYILLSCLLLFVSGISTASTRMSCHGVFNRTSGLITQEVVISTIEQLGLSKGQAEIMKIILGSAPEHTIKVTVVKKNEFGRVGPETYLGGHIDAANPFSINDFGQIIFNFKGSTDYAGDHPQKYSLPMSDILSVSDVDSSGKIRTAISQSFNKTGHVNDWGVVNVENIKRPQILLAPSSRDSYLKERDKEIDSLVEGDSYLRLLLKASDDNLLLWVDVKRMVEEAKKYK